MAQSQRSRLRWAALTSTLLSVVLVLALARFKRRAYACGWSHATAFRAEAGEGETAMCYWIGTVPGRFMLGVDRFDSTYPNDLPAGTKPQTSERTAWFCCEATAAQAIADWADPKTYQTTLGFAWMNELMDLSTHARQHDRVLILPHGLVLMLATAPTGVLALRLIRRGGFPPRGECMTCGYDLRATPDRCPECGTAVAR